MVAVLRSIRLLTVAVLVLATSGCGELLNAPVPDGPRPLSISLATAPESGQRASLAAAFARADRARVQVTRGGAVVLDTTVAFTGGEQREARLSVAVDQRLAMEPLLVMVELLGGTAVLFRGTNTVVLDRSATSQVQIALAPVVSRVTVNRNVPDLQAIGATLQLGGAALFASGDTVTGLPLSWHTIDTGVVDVTPDGRVTARSEGQARVEGIHSIHADTVRVTVRATIARITVEPASLSLTVGATGQLTATLFDSNANRILGREVSWTSSNPSFVELVPPSTNPVVTVRGVAAGTSTITASAAGLNAIAAVSVTNPAPAVVRLDPTVAETGSPGFALRVFGTGFVSASTVLWNGAVRPTEFAGPNELRASIGAADLVNASTAEVRVRTPAPGGGTSDALFFAVRAPPNPVPSLSSLNPASRPAGGSDFQLTLIGQNFASNAVVRWNGADRPTYFVTASELRAIVSAADMAEPGTSSVLVANPAPGGGQSNALTFVIEVPVNPLPAITGLSPSRAVAGGEQFTLVVTGQRFVRGALVRWNAVARATEYGSASELRAVIPASDVASPGMIPVTVSNPEPGGGVSNSVTFRVEPPPNSLPQISGLTPSQAPAGSPQFTLIISGQGFVNGSVVQWDGGARATQFVSDTEVRATIPGSDLSTVRDVTVRVFNPAPGGGESNAATFHVTVPPNPVPVISVITPSSAFAGGEPFTLIVRGQNFASGAVVRWEGRDRVTNFVGADELHAIIPASELETPRQVAVTVFNPAPGGGESNSRSFVVNPPPLPAAPTDLEASPDGETVYLSWVDNSNNETHFILQRSTRSGETFGVYVQIDSIPANTTFREDSAVEPGRTYRYRISACNQFGCSAWTINRQDATIDTEMGTVDGYVTTAESGGQIGISEARVEFRRSDSDNAYVTYTDFYGYYLIEAEVGYNLIEVSAPGYHTALDSVTVTTYGEPRRDFQLESEPITNELSWTGASDLDAYMNYSRYGPDAWALNSRQDSQITTGSTSRVAGRPCVRLAICDVET